MHCQAEPGNERKTGATPLLEPLNRLRGRSMLRPYGHNPPVYGAFLCFAVPRFLRVGSLVLRACEQAATSRQMSRDGLCRLQIVPRRPGTLRLSAR